MDEKNKDGDDSIRESVITRNLMKKLGRKKVRIKRLVKKSNGDLTLRDTTIMNETQDPAHTTLANESLHSQVDYKFTRTKDPGSFQPEMGFNPPNYQGADPFAMNPPKDEILQMGNFSKKQKFAKKKNNFEPEQVVTTDKVSTFAEMIQKDMKKSIEQKRTSEPVSKEAKVFGSVTMPSMSGSEYSTESRLFRLPQSVNALVEDEASLRESVKRQIEQEKQLTLDKFEMFKRKLVGAIEDRLEVYKKGLVYEYDDFYISYTKDLTHLLNKSTQYRALPKHEIDLDKNKIRFKKFEFYEEDKGETLQTEDSEIVTFPENISVVAKRKELGFLVEQLEKKMLHVPGFAKTETANEIMEETVGRLHQFCEKNLDFLGNMLYKTQSVPLENVRVRYEVESTNIPSSRQSVGMFKGRERAREAKDESAEAKNPGREATQAQNEKKEIHNIWKKSIERQRDRESRGERDEMSEQELQKREEMLNSMKIFDEQVKQYQEKMEKENQDAGEVPPHIAQPTQDASPGDGQTRADTRQANQTASNSVERDSAKAPVSELTEEQKMIIEQNRVKQELFLKKQNELRFTEGKSTYEKMSVYSMREEHLEPTSKEVLAQENAEKMKDLMDQIGQQTADLEGLLDEQGFARDSQGKPPTEPPKPEQVPPPPKPESKINIEELMKQQKLLEQKNLENQKELGLSFKRSNVNIDKIVKGKKLNGVSQSGDQLFFFGDEFIFKCSLSFQDPVMYKLGAKELTFMQSVQEEVGPDHYLLGITCKKRNLSEVLLIRLTKQFSLLKRVRIEEQQASGIISIFNLTGQKQFICVTRFGDLHLCDFSEPMIRIVAKESLNGERIETAILTARESSVYLVTQNSQIIGIEIRVDNGRAQKLMKSRILPLDNQANDIVKISEDQVGYCDEEGKFSLLTLPMEINGNKLGIKKTGVCDFPVDRLFVLESHPNAELDFRRDIRRLLMLNYEGYVAVFDFKKRKTQKHYDPKLVEDICLHLQNAILSKRSETQHDVLVLSTKTLKKLMIQGAPGNN